MSQIIKCPRKLIEVALPLDAINVAAAREKSIRHGHPSTLHLWWARRPLAAARAVIFGQLVNDPSWKWELDHPDEVPPGHLKASWAASRKRLFNILEETVKWENTTNEAVLERARSEIRKSWRETCEINADHPEAAELFNPDRMPGLHDPFAGGGAIPLEAQRLGLEAFASDLNPVAVLINKAMIEIPARFAGRPPVNPEAQTELGRGNRWNGKGAEGLAEDVRYYGDWTRKEAEKRIGHLYPRIEVTTEMTNGRPDLKPLVGKRLTAIAWIWARTVKSPNPAFSHVDVPLASTFILSSKKGREAYVQPVVEVDRYRFVIKLGVPPQDAEHGTKLARGANFYCLVSKTAIDSKHVYAEALAGRMGSRLLAVIAEGPDGRVYLEPSSYLEAPGAEAEPAWSPDLKMSENPRWFSPPNYGLVTYGDLFTRRQLVALTTFSDLVEEVRSRIRIEAVAGGMTDDGRTLDSEGFGATAYSEAVSVYLAFLIGQVANHSSTICGWNHPNTQMRSVFSRQAIPMTWDYAESNVFSESSGSYSNLFDRQIKGMGALGYGPPGHALQADAQTQNISKGKFVSTDPPYYDNIGYADLSDFFYVWMRRSLRSVFPQQLSTIAVPKADELVATPYRHGSKENAEKFFLSGMTQAMQRLADQAHPSTPITIYYAFKQSDTESDSGTVSTGWESFLDATIQSGFVVTGTWPMRTEKEGRSIGIGTNSLASSIIMVCRQRPVDAAIVGRREFLRALNAVLPEALDEMTKGSGDERSPVAPVDLSQAIIGPGMAVFSKYAAVLEADGSRMTVKTALQLINRFLAEADFDSDTQFCLHWFQQYGWKDGKFGDADTLARAKGTSVDGVKHAGVLYSSGGVVRLLRWSEYPSDWDPSSDVRLPLWEVLHQLIRVFKIDGEAGAGVVLASVQAKAEATRQLAYRLYTLCERAGSVEDARAYNEIVTSWAAIDAAAARVPGPRQADLF